MLHAALAFDGSALRRDVRLQVADGRISAVEFGVAPQPGDQIIADGVLAPGLIDTQINGYAGVDFAAATVADLETSLSTLAATGTTSCLPTIITTPIDELIASLDVIATVPQGRNSRILGVHVEGPFLSERRKGAHRAEFMCDPTPAALAPLLSHDTVRVITLAPEREHAMDAIAAIADTGRIASIGHTDSTAEQVHAAAAQGARMVTHMFNAQRPIGHKEAGVPGAALVDDRLFLGLIADLHHVTADMVVLSFAAASSRIVLVTDALASAGMPAGTYELGGESIVIDEVGQPAHRLDGTLSGSGLSLANAVKNVVGLGVSPELVLAAATSTPATLVGRDDLGRLAPGAFADLVLFDNAFDVIEVWLGGRTLAPSA